VSDAVAVGIDIGGTKILAVTLDADGVVLDREVRKTPLGDTEALTETIVEEIRSIGPDLPVGVGVAGVVGRDGTLRYGPNIEVTDVPLRARLEEELGVAVTVRNDATVALYGELRAGAGRGYADVVMVTVGTGFGGAVFTEGSLIEGANGMAGELGHLPIVDGGRRCPCGSSGCIEAYVSGTVIGARAREALAASDAETSLRSLTEVDGRAVTDAAREGDAFAASILRDVGYWLGVGLVGIVNAFDPEVVVVGGGAASRSADFILPPATEVVAERIIGADRRPVPQLVLAELLDDAGAIGAGLLIHDELRGAVGSSR
jgi:glucokinase